MKMRLVFGWSSIQTGEDPLTIVEDCQEGLRQVGERYEQRVYYLPFDHGR